MDRQTELFSALKFCFILILATILPGCGTFQYYSDASEREEHYPLYGGTGIVLGGRLISGGPHGMCSSIAYAVGLIDLPFSFAADTVLLPYSLPASILRYREDAPLRRLKQTALAVERCDVPFVKSALKEGVDPNTPIGFRCLLDFVDEQKEGAFQMKALLKEHGAKSCLVPDERQGIR